MEIEFACSLIKNSKYAIALSGAGISVDSNIPDFRSKGGLWEKFPPEEYATFSAFLKDPYKVWKLFHSADKLLKNAKPNEAHYALCELEKMGFLKTIITQNIDGLHQKAGSKRVIEFHGNTLYLTCIKCRKKILSESIILKSDEVPFCECGQVLKPDVVLFDEEIPKEALQMAFSEAQKCDLLLVCGTSAIVAPANFIPYIAKENGAKILEFNLTTTAISHLVERTFFGSTSKTLSEIVKILKK